MGRARCGAGAQRDHRPGLTAMTAKQVLFRSAAREKVLRGAAQLMTVPAEPEM